MNQVLSALLNQYMQGNLANHPLMSTVNRMMAGKSPEQQRQTVIEAARSCGFDLNQFPADVLRQAGLTQ